MSKFEPEQFINYERIEQNVEVVKKRLGHLVLSRFYARTICYATHCAFVGFDCGIIGFVTAPL